MGFFGNKSETSAYKSMYDVFYDKYMTNALSTIDTHVNYLGVLLPMVEENTEINPEYLKQLLITESSKLQVTLSSAEVTAVQDNFIDKTQFACN